MAKEQKPAWVYMLAGGIITAFVGGLIFLSQQDSGNSDFKTSLENSVRQHTGKDSRAVAEEQKDAPTKPSLDFYKMLPDFEVTVSPDLDVNIGSKPRSSSPQPKPSKPAAQGELYYLQVGAFSKQASAESQKAGLILKNWPTRVQQIRRDDGRSIYRILVGPYSEGTELSRAEKGLKQQGLKPVRQQTKS